MAIQVTCDSCFYSFSVKDEHAGKRGKCPECGEAVPIPSGRGGGSGSRSSRGAAPAAKSSRPASRSSKNGGGSSANVPLIVGGAVGGALLLGAIAFFAVRGGGGPANAGPNNAATVASNDTPANTAAPPPPGGAAGAPGTTPAAGTAPATTPISNNTPAPPPGIQTAGVTPPASAPGGITPPAGTSAGTTPPNATPGSAAAPGKTEPAKSEPSKTFTSVPDLVDAVKPSAVRIGATLAQGTSTGTGFVIDKEGTVVTNYHVIEGASKVSIYFADDSEAKAVGYLALVPKMDLAVLKVDCPSDKLHPVKLATTEPRSGETVVAIGMPLGLKFTTTKGDISAYRDSSELKQYGADYEGKWVQSTTPISPGNSGGPLFNMQGEVIGANTMSLAGGGAQNLNFATSAENIRAALGKKTSTLIAMAPSSAPPRENRRPGGNPNTISNETTTLKGKKLMANLQEVLLAEIDLSRLSLSNSSRVQDFVTGHAEKMWRRAGVNITKSNDAQAFMLVVMKLKQSGTSTASTIEVNAIVLMRDESGRRCKVFDQTDDCGQVSQAVLAKGNIPERTSKKVGDFFARIEKAIAKAKEDIAKEEGKDKPAEEGKDKPKEDAKDDKKK